MCGVGVVVPSTVFSAEGGFNAFWDRGFPRPETVWRLKRGCRWEQTLRFHAEQALFPAKVRAHRREHIPSLIVVEIAAGKWTWSFWILKKTRDTLATVVPRFGIGASVVQGFESPAAFGGP